MAKLSKIIEDTKLNFRQNKFLVKVFHTQRAYKYKGVIPTDGYYYARFTYGAIRNLLGYKTFDQIEQLEQLGYIERMKDKKDSHGNYIIKIRGTKKLEEAKFKMVNLSDYYDNNEFNRYNKSLAFYYKSIQSTDVFKQSAIAIEQIAKTIQKTTLSVTEEQIINLYKEKYKKEKRSITEKEYINMGLDLYYQFLELKSTNNINEIKETIIISKFGKRLFHPLINFIKKIRKHILIDEEETVSIDIKTSQVIFLAQLLKEKFNDQSLMGLIKKGIDIYDLISELENIPRNKAKKLFFFIIFGWTKQFPESFKKIFSKTTIDNIVKLKYTKVNKQVIKKNYSNLVYLLQELESFFTIRTTIKTLRGRNVPFLTIHDEFIVKKSQLNDALDAIRQSAQEFDLSLDFFRMLKLKIS